jgi:ABC-type branched-subunit amino acid transport system ATPase component
VNPVLEFEKVTRAYQKGLPVLDGVSFTMNEGEVVGLLGRNGVGQNHVDPDRPGSAAPLSLSALG